MMGVHWGPENHVWPTGWSLLIPCVVSLPHWASSLACYSLWKPRLNGLQILACLEARSQHLMFGHDAKEILPDLLHVCFRHRGAREEQMSCVHQDRSQKKHGRSQKKPGVLSYCCMQIWLKWELCSATQLKLCSNKGPGPFRSQFNLVLVWTPCQCCAFPVLWENTIPVSGKMSTKSSLVIDWIVQARPKDIWPSSGFLESWALLFIFIFPFPSFFPASIRKPALISWGCHQEEAEWGDATGIGLLDCFWMVMQGACAFQLQLSFLCLSSFLLHGSEICGPEAPV